MLAMTRTRRTLSGRRSFLKEINEERTHCVGCVGSMCWTVQLPPSSAARMSLGRGRREGKFRAQSPGCATATVAVLLVVQRDTRRGEKRKKKEKIIGRSSGAFPLGTLGTAIPPDFEMRNRRLAVVWREKKSLIDL